MRSRVAEDIRSIFNSPDLESARARLKYIIQSHLKTAPKFSGWIEDNIPQGFTVFFLPTPHQRRLRTSNSIKPVDQEPKRRTHVAPILPNEKSLLISARLCEISEEWIEGKTDRESLAPLKTRPTDLLQKNSCSAAEFGRFVEGTDLGTC
jgi:putative transposase